MALSYQDSDALMKDVVFIGRIKVACLKYATYIMGEAANTPAHSTRIRWAQNTAISPDQAALTITPTVVMDANVQNAGSVITDVELQAAVESAINSVM